MDEKPNESSVDQKLDRLLVFATGALLFLGLIAVGFYWYSLDRKLSGAAADWGAFGSYIGGVIGPAVSFVALVAVLRTIILQRDALITQREQFSKMMRSQDEVLASQTKQLRLAAQVAAADKVNAYKASVLNFAEQHGRQYRIAIERIDARLIALMSNAISTADALRAIQPTYDGLLGQKDHAEKQQKALLGAISPFLLKQHQSIEEIQADFQVDFMPIFDEVLD